MPASANLLVQVFLWMKRLRFIRSRFQAACLAALASNSAWICGCRNLLLSRKLRGDSAILREFRPSEFEFDRLNGVIAMEGIAPTD